MNNIKQLKIRGIRHFALLLAVIFISCNPNKGQVFNVRKFGAKGDGISLDKTAINSAIRQCYKSGGGTVFFPAGNYLSGTITLLSNVILELDAGATIIGSTKMIDYDSLFTVGNWGKALFIACKAENIGITGNGIIRGNGSIFMDFTKTYHAKDNEYHSEDLYEGPAQPKERPERLLVFDSCKNVSFRDIKIIDSPQWTIHLANCDNSQIIGIDIENNLTIPNNDGIHCTSCKNIFISDCHIVSGDDCIALTGYGNKERWCENIVLQNCNFVSRSSAIRIGADFGKIRNCVFKNCSINASNRGIGIFARNTGIVENIIISDFIIDTKLFTGNWWGQGEPIHISSFGKGEGYIKNIKVSNIIAEGEQGIIIYSGLGQNIKDVTFNNINLKLVKSKIGKWVGGLIDIAPRSEEKKPVEGAVFKHDIPALYIKNVEDFSLNQLNLAWGDSLPEYFSNAIQVDSSQNVIIDKFAGSQADKKYSAIDIKNSEDISIKNCKAAHGCSVFLNMLNVKKQKFFINNDLSEATIISQSGPLSFKVNSGNINPE